MEVSLVGLTSKIIILILSISKDLQGYVSTDRSWSTDYMFQHNMKRCNDIATKPYFSTDMVLGKPWRIYYEWNMDTRLHKNCLDMTFKYATSAMVTRIYSEMSEYLEAQPEWNAATLLVQLGAAAHEILLFTDQGPEGRFVGVTNVARDGRHIQMKNEVPLMKFQLKLYGAGKYLLMMDCQLGVGTLSVRVNQPAPTREEIDKLLLKHKLEPGFHSCANYDMYNPIG